MQEHRCRSESFLKIRTDRRRAAIFCELAPLGSTSTGIGCATCFCAAHVDRSFWQSALCVVGKDDGCPRSRVGRPRIASRRSISDCTVRRSFRRRVAAIAAGPLISAVFEYSRPFPRADRGGRLCLRCQQSAQCFGVFVSTQQTLPGFCVPVQPGSSQRWQLRLATWVRRADRSTGTGASGEIR